MEPYDASLIALDLSGAARDSGAVRRERLGAAEGARSDPELQLSVPVERGPSSLRAAKAQLRDALAEWQVDDRTLNAAVDVAHELMTNALRHAGAPIVVTVGAGAERVRVQVDDAAREPARMLPYRPGVSEHGLGLRLVQQLSSAWGQQLREDGKSVWAVFTRRSAS